MRSGAAEGTVVAVDVVVVVMVMVVSVDVEVRVPKKKWPNNRHTKRPVFEKDVYKQKPVELC